MRCQKQWRETVQVKPETSEREIWSWSNLDILIIVFGPVASEHSVPTNRSFLYEYEQHTSGQTWQEKYQLLFKYLPETDYKTSTLAQLRSACKQRYLKDTIFTCVWITSIICGASAHPNHARKLTQKHNCDLDFYSTFTQKHHSRVQTVCPHIAAPPRLTLNCTQVLRSASKFAPGHRVERSAFGTVSGSQTTNPDRTN